MLRELEAYVNPKSEMAASGEIHANETLGDATMRIYLNHEVRNWVSIRDILKGDAESLERQFMKALKRHNATEDQLSAARSLIGIENPVPVLTDADLGDVEHRSLSLKDALFQALAMDKRLTFCSRIYHLESPTREPKREDLRAHKLRIEPQLKREFDGYIGKLGVDTAAGNSLAANIIGMKVQEAGGVRPTPSRRRANASSKLTATYGSDFTNSKRDMATFAADFFSPVLSDISERGGIDKTTRRREIIEGMVMRALMPMDRICFAFGIGKPMRRSVLAQANIRAASRDIFRRGLLQPEGITPLLATLRIDADGTPAALPTIRLP